MEPAIVGWPRCRTRAAPCSWTARRTPVDHSQINSAISDAEPANSGSRATAETASQISSSDPDAGRRAVLQQRNSFNTIVRAGRLLAGARSVQAGGALLRLPHQGHRVARHRPGGPEHLRRRVGFGRASCRSVRVPVATLSLKFCPLVSEEMGHCHPPPSLSAVPLYPSMYQKLTHAHQPDSLRFFFSRASTGFCSSLPRPTKPRRASNNRGP